MLRVAIGVTASQAELAVAAWEVAGVHNSSVEYILDEPFEEPWPGHDNRSDRAEVAAYLTAEQWNGIEPAFRGASAAMLDRDPEIHVAPMPDRDWRTAWHDHFNLVRIPGSRPIIVRPPQIAYEAKPGEVVIDLVPGLAFGTGQHQSSRLCLGLLAERISGGEQVLDVGTGSGILAVAAARLGAATVLATDIDPLAVDAARQTVRQNRMTEIVDVRKGSIPAGDRFDLITANLTADILQHLAADLAAALRSGGTLIASGLIDARVNDVGGAFESVGLRVEVVEAEDEWRGMVLRAG